METETKTFFKYTCDECQKPRQSIKREIAEAGVCRPCRKMRVYQAEHQGNLFE